MRLDARKLAFRVGKTEILQDVSLSVLAGEFVGVLGPSGCGKSTLLKVLGGQLQASEGAVTFDGASFQPDTGRSIGFVPQDDIVHLGLTVEKALHYSARLRMDGEATPEQHQAAVEEALTQLDLKERRGLKISKLSGGQRKRVSIGVELLTQPSLLFLDEPTSGLDPALEEQFMQLCRQLARSGRTVVTTTHILQSLNLLDLVVVLTAGRLAYFGPVTEMGAFFGLAHPQEVYRLLQREEPADLASRYLRSSIQMEYVRERQSG